MSFLAGIAARIFGIWELAFGDTRGLRAFRAAPREVYLSFLAIPIALPAELAQRIDLWALDPASAPATALLRWHGLIIEGLTDLISWLAFLLLAYEICRLLKCSHRWVWLAVLWNWSQLVQASLALAANLPDLLGAPDLIGQSLLFVSLCWAIWFDWKIMRLSLGVPVLEAVMFVALDAVISNAVPVLAAHLNHLPPL